MAAALLSLAAGRREDLLRELAARGAWSAERAVRVADLPPLDRQAFTELCSEGVVRAAGASRYYLDERALRARERALGRTRRKLLVLLMVLATLLLGAALALRGLGAG